MSGETQPVQTSEAASPIPATIAPAVASTQPAPAAAVGAPAVSETPAPPEIGPAAPAVVLEPAEIAAGISVVDQNVMIPATAYRTLLQAATDAGRRLFEQSFQERLTKLGFSDLADLLEQVETGIATQSQEINVATPGVPAATPTAGAATPAAAAVTQPASGAAPQPTAPLTAPPPAAGAQPTPAQVAAAAADDPANDRRLPENLRRRVAQFRDQMRTRAETAENQARTHQEQVTLLQGQLAAARAEEALKIQMVQSGVKEIDFAWHQLSNELARLKADPSPEAKEKLKNFDVATWAAELRKTRPYLFGEQVVPATSPGPGPGAPAGAAPTPAAVTGQVTEAGQVDARTMDPKAFRARMDQLGVRYTGYSSPMKR